MKLNLIVVGVTAIFNFLTFGCVDSELNCTDMSKEFRNLPQEMEFQGCEPSNESQLRVLRATYQVSGKHSLAIETFLVNNYAMSSLRFVCCGWESITNSEGRRYGTYIDHRGYYDEIRMYSGEILIPDQLKREDVPYFYVEIIGFLA